MAASLLFSLFLWRAVKNDFSAVSGGDIAWGGGLAAGVVAVFLLSALLYSRIEAAAAAAALLLPFLFIVGFRWEYAVAALIAFLLFLHAILQVCSVRDSGLVFRFSPLIFRGAPAMLTGIAVLFASIALFYPFQADGIRIPPELFAYAVSFSEPFLERQMPSYRKGMSLDEFFLASASIELKGMDIAKAPPQAQSLIRAEVIKQRDGLAQQLGIRLSGSENLKELLALAANAYINRYFISYKDFVPALVAAFVFLSVKSFGFIVDRFAVFFAWGIARLLIAVGIARKEKTTVEKEILIV